MKKHESGRSMIEIVGVLAVMGLITAAAFVLMRSGMSSQKRNRVQDEIANIAANIRTLTAGSEDFRKLPEYGTIEKEGRIVLDNLDIQTTTPYGGDTFYSVTQANKDSSRFTVWIGNIDGTVCEALAQIGWAEGSATCDMKTMQAFGVTYGK